MVLSARALTTVEVLADELAADAPSSGSPEASRLERYIERASRQLAEMCGRTLHYVDGATSHVTASDAYRLVVDGPTPIVSVTSIELESYDGSLFEIDPDVYTIEDPDAGFIRRVQGVWRSSGHRDVFLDTIYRVPWDRYLVTYVGGWVTPQQAADDVSLERNLPEDLEAAALQIAAAHFYDRGRDYSIRREDLLSQRLEYFRAGEADLSLVAEVVRRYGRWGV